MAGHWEGAQLAPVASWRARNVLEQGGQGEVGLGGDTSPPVALQSHAARGQHSQSCPRSARANVLSLPIERKRKKPSCGRSRSQLYPSTTRALSRSDHTGLRKIKFLKIYHYKIAQIILCIIVKKKNPKSHYKNLQIKIRKIKF